MAMATTKPTANPKRQDTSEHQLSQIPSAASALELLPCLLGAAGHFLALRLSCKTYVFSLALDR
jgi:hypothetical protein